MLAVGLPGIGVPELLIILFVVVLIFGVGKMSDIGGALGKSIREFRKAAREPEEPEEEAAESRTEASAASTAPTSCTNCGAQLAAEAKFCAECGTSVRAAVK